MDDVPSVPRGLIIATLLVGLLAITACGTLAIDVQEPSPPHAVTAGATGLDAALPTVVSTGTALPPSGGSPGTAVEAVAWYGTIHTVEGAASGAEAGDM